MTFDLCHDIQECKTQTGSAESPKEATKGGSYKSTYQVLVEFKKGQQLIHLPKALQSLL